MDAYLLPWLAKEINYVEDGTSDSSMVVRTATPKPLYKLTFFNSRGLAEMSRLILVYSGIQFEDNRIGHDEWLEIKEKLLFHQLPCLEFDGNVLCESAAIARFLAKQFNLAGKTFVEQAKADSIIDFLKDFVTQLMPHLQTLIHSKTQKIKITSALIKLLHRNMPLLENLCKNVGEHGFLIASGLTYADFGLAVAFETLQKLYPSLLKPYGYCRRHCMNVYSLPKLQYYLKSRPDTLL